MGKGIDYGHGTTNRDVKTGIRYGVIPINDLSPWAWDDFEGDYGAPTCGHCGNDASEYDDETHGEYKAARGCSDYACETCERVFGSDDAFSDEPLSHNLDSGGYKATVGSSGDVFVVLSPYFTRAGFCSPCAPGACYLTDATDDGERAYCMGHDWFDGGTAPYPVYSVETGALVEPEAK